jgi:hypothetical protein
MQDDVALIGRCRDIEKGHFIGTLRIIATGNLDGIARIAQIDEVGTLDDPTGGNVKARNDAFCQPQKSTRAF